MAAESVSAGGILAVCLAGPTGTGKTALALRLAAEFAVEIVSVDSAMVYRHMDIGTAKPTAAVRAAVPHHLIDIREPWTNYSAGQFCADAREVIAAINRRGRVPLLVGGTMLYFRALLDGLSPLPPAQPAVRAAIDREAAGRGWAALHRELGQVDPVAAARIRPGDRQRIQRALEVFRITGRPISALQDSPAATDRLPCLRIALVPADRDALYRRLDERFAAMLAAGFIDEVARLREMSLMSAASPAMRAVGYRQVWRHLDGVTSLTEASREARVATRRLAKRQLTWLRAETAYQAVEPLDGDPFSVVAGRLAAAGVSREGRGCNIMGGRQERREHGV